jgi:hypothetical protein
MPEVATSANLKRTVYQKIEDGDGKQVSLPIEMYSIDAHQAVALHPEEWSFEPWDGTEGVNDAGGEPRAVIPNEWVDMKPSERIALARKLGAKDIRSGAAADEFINGYLVDRANAQASSEPASSFDRPNAELQEQNRSQTVQEAETGKDVENTAPNPAGPRPSSPRT